MMFVERRPVRPLNSIADVLDIAARLVEAGIDLSNVPIHINMVTAKMDLVEGPCAAVWYSPKEGKLLVFFEQKPEELPDNYLDYD